VTKFSVFTLLFLSLLLLLRGGCASREPRARVVSQTLSNALSSSFCRLLNASSSSSSFLFRKKRNKTETKRAERLSLLFCGKTQNKKLQKMHEKKEKLLKKKEEKGATKTQTKNNTSRFLKRMTMCYNLLDDDAHERSALLPPLRLLL